MSRNRTTTFFLVAILAMFVRTQASATELYYWVDEDGVANFSQNQPAETTPGVSKMELEDASQAGQDTQEEVYDVQAHEQRMSEWRAEREERRAAKLERQRRAAEQQAVQTTEIARNYAHPFWFPPRYQKPRPKPRPPIEEPASPASTLKLPGKGG
jgi:hypothetical protein